MGAETSVLEDTPLPELPYPPSWVEESSSSEGGHAAVSKVLASICEMSSQDYLAVEGHLPELSKERWDFDSFAPYALVALSKHPQLQKRIDKMVPKLVLEEEFWRLFYCHVHATISSVLPAEAKAEPAEVTELPAKLGEEEGAASPEPAGSNADQLANSAVEAQKSGDIAIAANPEPAERDADQLANHADEAQNSGASEGPVSASKASPVNFDPSAPLPYPASWTRVLETNGSHESIVKELASICELDDSVFTAAKSPIPRLSPQLWSFDDFAPYAEAACTIYPQLQRRVYKLVPQKLSETEFWRLFYCNVQHVISCKAASFSDLEGPWHNNDGISVGCIHGGAMHWHPKFDVADELSVLSREGGDELVLYEHRDGRKLTHRGRIANHGALSIDWKGSVHWNGPRVWVRDASGVDHWDALKAGPTSVSRDILAQLEGSSWRNSSALVIGQVKAGHLHWHEDLQAQAEVADPSELLAMRDGVGIIMVIKTLTASVQHRGAVCLSVPATITWDDGDVWIQIN
eukprot:TRINITY_DN10573_c0_g3_i1.p1 TRINITY_DN10573_c0_g3~~TRINITY_DN10573_c0_g3_i1.p1  ORF type:complete len:546 (+),score=95.17 TRINITY_DN10573_c0_g3_i1:79-1638(+)